MKNYFLIKVTQYLPARLAACVRTLRSMACKNQQPKTLPIEGIDHFESEGSKSKRALIMLHPEAWPVAVNQYPTIKLFNYVGLTYNLVKALNKNGYLVDIVSMYEEFTPQKDYDIFVGHGAKCRTVIDKLDPETPIYQYVSGAFWETFNQESEERYNRFFDKHGKGDFNGYLRSMDDLVEGEKYLTEKAKTLFTINCPRMIQSFGDHTSKFYFTGLGAYIDELFVINDSDRDYDKGRKNFIYVGGSGGNIQKGMDLLVEAFSQMPDLHLYIYCKVEEELLKYCKKELGCSNIHYIYHWRYKPFHNQLRTLLKETVFSVHAPINTGMGTAFMATMGVGMIPVGYVDLVDHGESAVLTDSWDIDSLIQCIQHASNKSPKWCQEAAVLTLKNYSAYCDPEKVGENLEKMFSLTMSDSGQI